MSAFLFNTLSVNPIGERAPGGLLGSSGGEVVAQSIAPSGATSRLVESVMGSLNVDVERATALVIAASTLTGVMLDIVLPKGQAQPQSRSRKFVNAPSLKTNAAGNDELWVIGDDCLTRYIFNVGDGLFYPAQIISSQIGDVTGWEQVVPYHASAVLKVTGVTNNTLTGTVLYGTMQAGQSLTSLLGGGGNVVTVGAPILVDTAWQGACLTRIFQAYDPEDPTELPSSQTWTNNGLTPPGSASPVRLGPGTASGGIASGWAVTNKNEDSTNINAQVKVTSTSAGTAGPWAVGSGTMFQLTRDVYNSVRGKNALGRTIWRFFLTGGTQNLPPSQISLNCRYTTLALDGTTKTASTANVNVALNPVLIAGYYNFTIDTEVEFDGRVDYVDFDVAGFDLGAFGGIGVPIFGRSTISFFDPCGFTGTPVPFILLQGLSTQQQTLLTEFTLGLQFQPTPAITQSITGPQDVRPMASLAALNTAKQMLINLVNCNVPHVTNSQWTFSQAVQMLDALDSQGSGYDVNSAGFLSQVLRPLTGMALRHVVPVLERFANDDTSSRCHASLREISATAGDQIIAVPAHPTVVDSEVVTQGPLVVDFQEREPDLPNDEDFFGTPSDWLTFTTLVDELLDLVTPESDDVRCSGSGWTPAQLAQHWVVEGGMLEGTVVVLATSFAQYAYPYGRTNPNAVVTSGLPDGLYVLVVDAPFLLPYEPPSYQSVIRGSGDLEDVSCSSVPTANHTPDLRRSIVRQPTVRLGGRVCISNTDPPIGHTPDTTVTTDDVHCSGRMQVDEIEEHERAIKEKHGCAGEDSRAARNAVYTDAFTPSYRRCAVGEYMDQHTQTDPRSLVAAAKDFRRLFVHLPLSFSMTMFVDLVETWHYAPFNHEDDKPHLDLWNEIFGEPRRDGESMPTYLSPIDKLSPLRKWGHHRAAIMDRVVVGSVLAAEDGKVGTEVPEPLKQHDGLVNAFVWQRCSMLNGELRRFDSESPRLDYDQEMVFLLPTHFQIGVKDNHLKVMLDLTPWRFIHDPSRQTWVRVSQYELDARARLPKPLYGGTIASHNQWPYLPGVEYRCPLKSGPNLAVLVEVVTRVTAAGTESDILHACVGWEFKDGKVIRFIKLEPQAAKLPYYKDLIDDFDANIKAFLDQALEANEDVSCSGRRAEDGIDFSEPPPIKCEMDLHEAMQQHGAPRAMKVVGGSSVILHLTNGGRKILPVHESFRGDCPAYVSLPHIAAYADPHTRCSSSGPPAVAMDKILKKESHKPRRRQKVDKPERPVSNAPIAPVEGLNFAAETKTYIESLENLKPRIPQPNSYGFQLPLKDVLQQTKVGSSLWDKTASAVLTQQMLPPDLGRVVMATTTTQFPGIKKGGAVALRLIMGPNPVYVKQEDDTSYVGLMYRDADGVERALYVGAAGMNREDYFTDLWIATAIDATIAAHVMLLRMGVSYLYADTGVAAKSYLTIYSPSSPSNEVRSTGKLDGSSAWFAIFAAHLGCGGCTNQTSVIQFTGAPGMEITTSDLVKKGTVAVKTLALVVKGQAAGYNPATMVRSGFMACPSGGGLFIEAIPEFLELVLLMRTPVSPELGDQRIEEMGLSTKESLIRKLAQKKLIGLMEAYERAWEWLGSDAIRGYVDNPRNTLGPEINSDFIDAATKYELATNYLREMLTAKVKSYIRAEANSFVDMTERADTATGKAKATAEHMLSMAERAVSGDLGPTLDDMMKLKGASGAQGDSWEVFRALDSKDQSDLIDNLRRQAQLPGGRAFRRNNISTALFWLCTFLLQNPDKDIATAYQTLKAQFPEAIPPSFANSPLEQNGAPGAATKALGGLGQIKAMRQTSVVENEEDTRAKQPRRARAQKAAGVEMPMPIPKSQNEGTSRAKYQAQETWDSDSSDAETSNVDDDDDDEQPELTAPRARSAAPPVARGPSMVFGEWTRIGQK